MAADEAECAVAADGGIVEGQQAQTLFWFDEAVSFEDTTLLLLGDEGKDHHHLLHAAAPTTARCVQVESSFPVEESARISPRNQEQEQDHHRVDDVEAEPVRQQHVQEEEEAKGVAAAAAVDVRATSVLEPEQRRSAPAPAVVVSPSISPEDVSIQGNSKQEISRSGEDDARRDADAEHEEEAQQAGKSFPEGQGQHHDLKLFVSSRALADTRKLLLEGVVAAGGGAQKAQEQEQDEEKQDRNAGDSSRFGASTESTSKSSAEWRSSTVTNKDSETEYPFSSSSRRSSARWESYTLFRKYDDDMLYFHRVAAQKLTETESFRSIKYQPRSMSERIVRRLTPKPPIPPAIGLRDPYPELERAYVAQVCLTWEALSWNHATFRRHNAGDGNLALAARVAQEFQQFQVLLHRFVENEPYEHGRRPEVYARMKNSTPKLLLVPEFRDDDDEKDGDLISAAQFLMILEESIRTFMAFLRADRRSHYEMFREMVRRRAGAAAADQNQTLVLTLKKANKRKKRRLKDLTRPRRCLKRTRLREEEELSVLLGLIDLKVVARVLRMPEVTEQQLLWCEEKMNRVRIDQLEGRMQRDPAPLFYPAH